MYVFCTYSTAFAGGRERWNAAVNAVNYVITYVVMSDKEMRGWSREEAPQLNDLFLCRLCILFYFFHLTMIRTELN